MSTCSVREISPTPGYPFKTEHAYEARHGCRHNYDPQDMHTVQLGQFKDADEQDQLSEIAYGVVEEGGVPTTNREKVTAHEILTLEKECHGSKRQGETFNVPLRELNGAETNANE